MLSGCACSLLLALVSARTKRACVPLAACVCRSSCRALSNGAAVECLRSGLCASPFRRPKSPGTQGPI
eukprot:6212405-Pleurochrysis_carterae.AAC.4